MMKGVINLLPSKKSLKRHFLTQEEFTNRRSAVFRMISKLKFSNFEFNLATRIQKREKSKAASKQF